MNGAFSGLIQWITDRINGGIVDWLVLGTVALCILGAIVTIGRFARRASLTLQKETRPRAPDLKLEQLEHLLALDF